VVKTKQVFNLLPKDELEKSTFGQFLKWALSIGRYIVMSVELLVILAFLFRFKLDQDKAALTEEIKRQQTVIGSFTELEKNVRYTQKRLELVKKIKQEPFNPSQILEDLAKLTPIDVTLSELAIKNDSLIIKGYGLSNVGLDTFLSGLKSSKKFSQINLQSVSSKGRKDPTLNFELTIKVEKS